jgi:5,10-methylenetetrahydromethanopterin reductase
MALEIWSLVLWADGSSPGAIVERGVQREREGYDGVYCPDTQNLAPDVYVCLAAMALETERIQLATGVTNPITRHPAVTASAAAALQSLSGGRAVVSIGRGDSALAHLGASPVRLATFERYVDRVRRYLSGEGLPLDESVPEVHGTVAGFENLSLGVEPDGSRLRWLDPALPRVPVEVTATGPKALRMGGRVADRVALTVGSDPTRVAWAIEQVRRGAREAGRDPDAVSIGAYLTAVPTEDRERGLELVRPMVAGMARFAFMDKVVTGPATEHQRRSMERLMDGYDMNLHGDATQLTSAVDDAFADSYVIVGTTSECEKRIRELAALGLDRIVLSHVPQDRPEYGEIQRRVVEELIPAVRGSA